MSDETPTPDTEATSPVPSPATSSGLTREQEIQSRLDAISPHLKPTIEIPDAIMRFRQHSVADMTYLLDSNVQLVDDLATVRAATDNHPDPCGEHPDGDAISCGWKHAYADVCHALATVDSRSPLAEENKKQVDVLAKVSRLADQFEASGHGSCLRLNCAECVQHDLSVRLKALLGELGDGS